MARKRVSKDQVRDNAKKGDFGPRWLNLPDGVDQWEPEKKGKYRIDVLPYEISDKKHPDELEKGTIWYKRRFTVHRNVGPEKRSYVCPLSVGKPCPIHEERARLAKKKDTDQEVLKDLDGKRIIMMNIKHPEDPKRVAVFVMSQGKFWSADAGLKKELDEGDEENLTFFDVKGGKTIVARFSEEKYAGHTFLQVSRIDFEDRKDLDEERVLKKTVDLDTCLNVMPYDKLKDIMAADEADDAEEEDEDEDDEKPAKKKGKKPARDEDEEDEEEDEEESDDEDEDEESDDEESDDEDEEEEEESDDEDADEDEDEKPAKKSSKVKAKKKKGRD